MQVTLIIDDIQLEALEESAAKAGLDIDDLLGRAVGLVLEECRLASREPPSRVAATWSVDPISKAVTRIESHPLARPEDWDQAMERAKRAASNPTVEAFRAGLADALHAGHGKGGYAFPPGPATDALIKSINGANATNPPAATKVEPHPLAEVLIECVPAAVPGDRFAPGTPCTVNTRGDMCIVADARGFFSVPCVVVKRTKAGLILVARTDDLTRTHPFPQKNIDPLEGGTELQIGF